MPLRVELENMLVKLDSCLEGIEELEMALGVEMLRKEQKELEGEMAGEGFWNDLERSQQVNKRLVSIQGKLGDLKALKDRIRDGKELLELMDMEGDLALVDEALAQIARIEADMAQMHLKALFTGPYDACDCLLTLHAGAGGTEAQDWVKMLYRMYQHYGQVKGYALRELDFLAGDEAGIKSVTLEVKGENAYGYLKAERGVHRLVRISPFDASARRHTSFASLDVTPVLEDEGGIEINAEDLRIDRSEERRVGKECRSRWSPYH